MKTYRIKATITVEVEQDICAESEDEARGKFFEQSIAETIDDSLYIGEVNTDIDEINLTEGTFKVKVSRVNYDVDYYSCSDIVAEADPDVDDCSDEFDQLVYAKIEEIKAQLPQEMELELECERDDLEDYIADEISEKTNWLVYDFDYSILEVK